MTGEWGSEGIQNTSTNSIKSVTGNIVGAVECIKTVTQFDYNSGHFTKNALPQSVCLCLLAMFNEVIKMGQMLSVGHITGVT